MIGLVVESETGRWLMWKRLVERKTGLGVIDGKKAVDRSGEWEEQPLEC